MNAKIKRHIVNMPKYRHVSSSSDDVNVEKEYDYILIPCDPADSFSLIRIMI